MPFLVCNTNTYGHTDYGIPVHAQKSTDYRTTTGTNHSFIPPFPINSDCRVKAKIYRVDNSNPILNKDTYTTNYNDFYDFKTSTKDCANDYQKSSRFYRNHYLRTIQEKMFKKPSPPLAPRLSEMKEEYQRKFHEFPIREVYPPNPTAYCEVKALGRDEQPPIVPEEQGYYKHLDPYLTTSRASFVPYNQSKQDGIARKDIVTYYDASNIPKGGKGFGPKNGPQVGAFQTRKDTKPKNRIVRMPMKTLDNFGKVSEYKDMYSFHTYSDLYPYLFDNGQEFTDSLPKSSPWQDLAAPAMYCTEQCHIGSGWPVFAALDIMKPKRLIKHTLIND